LWKRLQQEKTPFAPVELAVNDKSWMSEAFILRTLRRLADQRVVMVLQPGNVWVLDRALDASDDEHAALRTCHMRGWVEPLVESAVPHADISALREEGDIRVTSSSIVYRLTDSGWNAINGTHNWVIRTYAVSLLALIVAVAALVVAEFDTIIRLFNP
jgi:hypothetical protein